MNCSTGSMIKCNNSGIILYKSQFKFIIIFFEGIQGSITDKTFAPGGHLNGKRVSGSSKNSRN